MCIRDRHNARELPFPAMDSNALANQYRAKTDEEFLQLAGESEQLTPEARSVLKGELSKRRIEALAGNSQASNEQEPAVSTYLGSASAQSIGEF